MKTRRFNIPPFYYFWIIFALTLSLGTIWHREIGNVFGLSFLLVILGAALPTIGVLAHGARRLGSPLAWQQIALALFIGGSLSIIAAFILEMILPLLVWLLIPQLGYLASEFGDIGFGTPGFLERLFFTPAIILFLIFTAIQAPIPEEFTKALGPLILDEKVKNERQAFMLGLAAGAGFAILENVLYESIYAQWNGWSWGGITLLRGFGSILHPLCTGIISLALYRARGRIREKSWLVAVGPAYLLSVGIHTLWNGGFEPLVYLTGLNSYLKNGPTFSFFGLAVPTLLVVFLIVLSAALWGYFIRLTKQLGQDDAQLELLPALVSRRTVAGAAFAMVVVLVPMGAMLGPAWPSIHDAAVGGVPATSTPVPTPTLQPTPTRFVRPTSTPFAAITSTRSKDGMTMVSVPGGPFVMGGATSSGIEVPTHTVTLDTFWIDQTEVTNGKYAKCVQAGACQVPQNNTSHSHPTYYGFTSFSSYPVIYVNWNQAKTYCAWAGGRLPSEAEWEKAAVGSDARTYPWGENIDNTYANFNLLLGDTSIVGSYKKGVSPYGAYDMAGNVSEWVADWYGSTYYQSSSASNPTGPTSGEKRVIRGGSWGTSDADTRSSIRDFNYPNAFGNALGFRCASSSAPG